MNIQLDHDFLDVMYGKDDEFKKEVFATFSDQLPGEMRVLHSLFENEDIEGIAQHAHKIKPMFGMVGLTQIQDLVKDLELGAKSKISIQTLEVQFRQIKSAIEEAKPLIVKEAA